MPKKFTYTNLRTGRVIFESVEPNHVSRDDVDQKVKDKTGRDPRLEPHLIECQIRIVTDEETLPRPKIKTNTNKHKSKKKRVQQIAVVKTKPHRSINEDIN